MIKWKIHSIIAGCAVFVAILFSVAEVEARRGGGGGGRGGGKSFSRSGPASNGSMRSQKPMSSQRSVNRGNVQENRGSRQNNRSDNQGNRKEHRNDRLDSRLDHRDDVREDRQDYIDDVRDDRQDWYDDRYRRAVGVSLTYSSFRSLSCTTTTVNVNGVTYYRCGSDWYSRAYHGGNVTYVVVTAPAGY